MIKILFVCHGNICRSPMAEFILKDMAGDDVIVASAATSREEIGNDMYPPARRELTRRGVPFTHRQARQITKDEYADWNLIYCMDDANVRNAIRIFGGDPEGKVRKLLPDRSVADPWYTGDFAEAYEDIAEGCRNIIKELA